MKRMMTALLVASMYLTAAPSAHAESVAQEAAEHPRIVNAIRELEEAIKYLEAAPHNFGGNKAAAIQSCRAAVQQLTQALKFRAKQDTKRGK